MAIIKYFLMTMLFFVLIGSVAGFAYQMETEKQENVADIDNQILELERMKRGYEAKALRHEDQAERLQFDHDTWLEAKRHMQLADENREMAKRIQAEIDRLKARRLEILRQNGDNTLPPEGGDGFEDI